MLNKIIIKIKSYFILLGLIIIIEGNLGNFFHLFFVRRLEEVEIFIFFSIFLRLSINKSLEHIAFNNFTKFVYVILNFIILIPDGLEVRIRRGILLGKRVL